MSDDFGIAGKTALVTGSGRNIGRAIALELAARGANVIVNARSDEAEADAVAKAAEDLGARSLVVMGDAGDKATVEPGPGDVRRRRHLRQLRSPPALQGLLRAHRRGLALPPEPAAHGLLVPG